MEQHQAEERTTLFGILTAVTLAMVVAVVAVTAHKLVPLWVLLAIVVPWLAFSIVLRIRRDDWGREGKYFDLWSIPHAFAGVMLGLVDVRLVWVVLLTVWWEGVEAVSRVHEQVPNRFIDVAIACVGWSAAQWLAGGGFALV